MGLEHDDNDDDTPVVTIEALIRLATVPLIAFCCYRYRRDPMLLILSCMIVLAASSFVSLRESAARAPTVVATAADAEYDMLSAEEIVKELNGMEREQKLQDDLKKIPLAVNTKEIDDKSSGSGSGSSDQSDKQNPIRCLRCLGGLARKCGQHQAQQKQQQKAAKKEWLLQYKPHELEKMCQEAAYVALRLFSNNEKVVASSLALLALIAKDEQVRTRHIESADVYGLNEPVAAMRRALRRVKDIDEDAIDSQKVLEREERQNAELQRKGCLFIGALADGDQNIATKLVDEGGLEAVLDAVNWYRYHSEVANWSLWAVFCLCYDHMGNKQELIRLGGINRVCRVMKDIPESLEVSRHGLAILFDVMRQVPNKITDVAKIRAIAVNAGVHEVVVNAMNSFSNAVDIMMMGQQMLVATGYKGEIPMMKQPPGGVQ